MSSPETNDLAAVVEALREHDRFTVTTHENPDGDALGSLLATKLGLDHRIFQGVYESVQFAKLKLLARALERAQVLEGGRVVVSYLLRTDFAEVGAAEPYSEGIIDFLRAVEGADMAVLIREPPREDGPARRVSLRASIDELDVSAIARKSDGGGHRQAAGFSSEASIEEITDFVRREVLASSRA